MRRRDPQPAPSGAAGSVAPLCTLDPAHPVTRRTRQVLDWRAGCGHPRAAGSRGRSRRTDPAITNTGGGARDQAFWAPPPALTQPKSQAARRSRVRTPGSGRRRALFLYNGVAPGISPGRPASPPARAPCVNKHIHPAAVSLRSASRARSLSLGRWRVTKEGARGLGTGSSQQRSSDQQRQHLLPQVGPQRRTGRFIGPASSSPTSQGPQLGSATGSLGPGHPFDPPKGNRTGPRNVTSRSISSPFDCTSSESFAHCANRSSH